MDSENQIKETSHLDFESDLGQVIESYPTKNLLFKRWGLLAIGVLIILSSLIVFLFYLFNTLTAINIYGLAILLKRIPKLLIVIGFGLLVGLPALIIPRRQWQNAITLHEYGMVLQKNHQTQIMVWKDITRLDSQITSVAFAGSDVTLKIRLIMENQQQQKLIIKNQYEPMDKLIHQIRSSVLPSLYDRTCKRLANKENLAFRRDLKATWKGLLIKEHLIPYSEFDQPKFTNRHLVLIQKTESKKPFQFNLHQIKNLDLLLQLLAYPPQMKD